MRAGDYMTRAFDVVHPDSTVGEVGTKLGADPVPVCEHGQLIGLISDRDLSRRGRWGRILSDTPVREIITPEVLYCFEDTELSEAVALMNEKQVARLPVVSARGKLVGILRLDRLPAGRIDPSDNSPLQRSA